MSFLIAVYVNEGIVLASDRRTTYTTTVKSENQTISNFIYTCDSADKTFICPNGAGLSRCGDSSLLEKPLNGYIQNMIREKIGPQCKVSDMPQIIMDYFNGFSSVPNVHFIVAGYETVDFVQRQLVYKLNVKDKSISKIPTEYQGATWDGETHTLTRLIMNTAVRLSDGTYSPLPYEEILWKYFTLQDAVDFVRYAVETTSQTMRFKNVRNTVGGKVDILVITPEETRWLQKETLK